MAKTRRKSAAKAAPAELDSVYLLKLVIYMILGSCWVRITLESGFELPLPLGALIGLLYARHDHFAIDRKIEYAVLLVAMFVGFWLPIGISISL